VGKLAVVYDRLKRKQYVNILKENLKEAVGKLKFSK